MRQALERLCVRTVPPGFEAPAVAVAAELLRLLVDETFVGRMGNVLGMYHCGREGAPRFLLGAHLDEIDLLAVGMEDGFLCFRSIGGVDSRMLFGRELVMLTDPPQRGTVICPAGGETDKSILLSKLFVDVGLSRTEAERAIPAGTSMVYWSGYLVLGEDQICGKSMDGRSCFVILSRAAELLRDRELGVDLYLLGSTREEVSGAGATIGTQAVQPGSYVAMDVIYGETPDGSTDKAFAIGGSPAIGAGPNMTHWMINRMLAKARERQIPYQLEVVSGHTGTNSREIQISRKGVTTSVLSLSLKYMHSPIKVLSLADVEQVAALLIAFTEGLGKEAARR